MIWVDCDGVLADFNALYLRLLYATTGRQHTHEEITDFEFSKCVASEAENEKVWRALDRRPGDVYALSELPGALAGLKQLRTLGKVGCLTSPHLGPHWMFERAQWLMARGFKRRQIIFAADKSPVAGRYLIDDKFENCEEWSAFNGRPAILIDAPHNRQTTLFQRVWGAERIWRVRDLVHAAELIRNYELR